MNDSLEDHPLEISDVLKALNHPLRRELLIFLSDQYEASFSQLHNHVKERTKSTGQFSYHLKLLVDAQVILKHKDNYRLSQIGEKATAMIQMIDIEVDRSISQQISLSFEQLSPLELITITWLIVPLFSFALIFSGSLHPSLDPLFVIFLNVFSVLLLLGSAIYAYSKLQYLPSLLVLSNIVWLFFLPKGQLKIGAIYASSATGLVFFLSGILVTPNILSMILGLLLLLGALILSILYIRAENNQLIDIRIR